MTFNKDLLVLEDLYLPGILEVVGDKAEAQTGPRNEPVSLRVPTRQLDLSGQQNSRELQGQCVACDRGELHNKIIKIFLVFPLNNNKKEEKFTGILSPATSFSVDR